MELLLAGFFVIGSISFWIGILFIMGLLAFGLNKESVGGTFVILLATLIGFIYFQKINLFSYVLNNWGSIALYAVGYLVIGIVWSIVKYWMHAKKLQNIYNDIKEEFLARKKKLFKDLKNEEKIEFLGIVKNDLYRHLLGKSYPLKVVEHKAFLSLATLYWPVSFLYTLLDDPLRELLNYIYRKFKSVYQKISDNTSKDFNEDFKEILNPIEEKEL